MKRRDILELALRNYKDNPKKAEERIYTDYLKQALEELKLVDDEVWSKYEQSLVFIHFIPMFGKFSGYVFGVYIDRGNHTLETDVNEEGINYLKWISGFYEKDDTNVESLIGKDLIISRADIINHAFDILSLREPLLECIRDHPDKSLYLRKEFPGGICLLLEDSLKDYSIVLGNFNGLWFHTLQELFPKLRYIYALFFGAKWFKNKYQLWWNRGYWSGGRLRYLLWLKKQYENDTRNILS